MNSITPDMKYRQSLLTYAQKYGVSRASRKYNKSRSYIYFWRARYDGSLQSLACQSRRPHSHPTSIPKRSSSSSLICIDETPTWGSWSYGCECGNEDIHEPWKASGG